MGPNSYALPAMRRSELSRVAGRAYTCYHQFDINAVLQLFLIYRFSRSLILAIETYTTTAYGIAKHIT